MIKVFNLYIYNQIEQELLNKQFFDKRIKIVIFMKNRIFFDFIYSNIVLFRYRLRGEK